MATDDREDTVQDHDAALTPIEQRHVVIEGEQVLVAWVGADVI